MDTEKNSVSILESVNEKHPYLKESKLPISKTEDEILIEIQELEDSVLTKRHLTRLMNDNLEEIDNEICRWENKKKLLDSFSQQLRDYEKKLQDKIIKIRQSRKEVAMESIIKQKMSEELRNNLPDLMQNYGRLMQEPSEITKVKFSSELAENQAEVIANIRKKVSEAEKEEKPKDKKEEKKVEEKAEKNK